MKFRKEKEGKKAVTQHDQAKRIIKRQLKIHQNYLTTGHIASLAISGVYWAFLTIWDKEITLLNGFAFVASCFLLYTYEGTKIEATKYQGRGAVVSLISFIVFSALTSIGTMMLMEQGNADKRTTESESYQANRSTRKQATEQMMQFAWAKDIDIDAEEKKLSKLLNSPALLKGKKSGYNVSYVYTKQFKSYAQYTLQVDDIKKKIASSRSYRSAENQYNHFSKTTNSSGASGGGGTWLQIALSKMFFDGEIIYAALFIYMLGTAVLELSNMFNGKKYRELTTILYGIDTSDLNSMREIMKNSPQSTAGNHSSAPASSAPASSAPASSTSSAPASSTSSTSSTSSAPASSTSSTSSAPASSTSSTSSTSSAPASSPRHPLSTAGTAPPELDSNLLKIALSSEFGVVAIGIISGKISPVQNQIVKGQGVSTAKTRAILTLLTARNIEILENIPKGKKRLYKTHNPTKKPLPFSDKEAAKYVQNIIKLVGNHEKTT